MARRMDESGDSHESGTTIQGTTNPTIRGTASAGPPNDGAAKSIQMLVLPAVSCRSHQMNPSNCIRDTSQRFCVTYSRPG